MQQLPFLLWMEVDIRHNFPSNRTGDIYFNNIHPERSQDYTYIQCDLHLAQVKAALLYDSVTGSFGFTFRFFLMLCTRIKSYRVLGKHDVYQQMLMMKLCKNETTQQVTLNLYRVE